MIGSVRPDAHNQCVWDYTKRSTGCDVSTSARINQGDGDTRQAYEAVTLRLARERVTDDRPLRDVLKDVTATAASALRVQRVSVWFFVDEPRSIRCDYLHQPDRGEINARDAMPAGGVVTVELREESVGRSADSQSTFVVIQVSDTGVGMDRDTRERMCDSFFTTKGNQGRGLGMSIVKQIVTMAGGFLQVDSAPGGGTRIRLYLPLIAGNEAAPVPR